MSVIKPVEIYVHVPFCVRKCAYCDFYSGAFGDDAKARYFDDVNEEIRTSKWADSGVRVSSAFFGGGTPSSVDPQYIGDVLNSIRAHFSLLPGAEISIECNPGTVTKESLSAYRSFGINRLSFGLQTADNGLLQKIGRIHTFEQFLEGYEAAKEAGFDNISVDLIAGLPTDTVSRFEQSLSKVISLQPKHLSVYSLIIEENTPFYALYGPDGTLKSELPSEDEEREMIHLAKRRLEEAGYVQYEISNFARPGFESRHNEGYWTYVPYLGFGAAASSFIEGRRFKNASSLSFLDAPYEETETLSKEEQEGEFLMLGMRRLAGVSDEDFRNRFGRSFRDAKGSAIRKLLEEGLIVSETDPGQNEKIRLSDRGLDVANLVFMELL